MPGRKLLERQLMEKPMKLRICSILRLVPVVLSVALLNAQNKQTTDTSPHSIQMISVEPDVKLEVLD
jgi:hypothetical protein